MNNMNENNNTVVNKMFEIMKFDGIQVDIIIENGEPLFEIYSTGMALGQVVVVKGKSYPRKDRIEENLKSAEIDCVFRHGKLYINESQLYDLMLEMKTDKVKPFRKWIINEVIPAIRKTGGYIPVTETDTELEIMSKAFLITTRTIEQQKTKIAKLEKVNEQQQELISEQTEQLEEQRPLVEFAEAVSNSSDTINVGQLAKLARNEDIEIGRNRLYRWMKRKGILRLNGEPYQRYIQSGWFIVNEEVYHIPYKNKISVSPRVTGKGQIALIKKLRKDFCE